MTNLEWIKKNINEMSAEELRDWKYRNSPWCQDDCIAECQKCAKLWLEAKHQEPMPELKTGMMVKVTDEYNGVYWGIIREREGRKIITYADSDGGFDFIEDVTIDAIYDAPSFLYARQYDGSIIWSKD